MRDQPDMPDCRDIFEERPTDDVDLPGHIDRDPDLDREDMIDVG